MEFSIHSSLQIDYLTKVHTDSKFIRVYMLSLGPKFICLSKFIKSNLINFKQLIALAAIKFDNCMIKNIYAQEISELRKRAD